MKSNKLLKFFLSSVLVFSFLGCQNSADDQQNLDDQPLDRRIGEIKSLGGAKTSSEGTHILELDDGEVILLKSDQINLNDSKYENKVVELRGTSTYTKDSKQIMTVYNIDILEEADLVDDESATWEVYANDFFSITYKSDFDVKEDETDITYKKESYISI